MDPKMDFRGHCDLVHRFSAMSMGPILVFQDIPGIPTCLVDRFFVSQTATARNFMDLHDGSRPPVAAPSPALASPLAAPTCTYRSSVLRRAACIQHARRENSATGTRTRVARVRAEYPNQLDYSGFDSEVLRAGGVDDSAGRSRKNGRASARAASKMAYLISLEIRNWNSRKNARQIATGTWCSGITSASHAEGPGFKSQCVHSCAAVLQCTLLGPSRARRSAM